MLNFFVHVCTFGRINLCSGASQNPLVGMNATSQNWESLKKKLRKFQKLIKLTFLRGKNCKKKKLFGVAAYAKKVKATSFQKQDLGVVFEKR